MDERFERICDVLAEFRRSGLPLLEVVRASGYPDLRGRFAASELAAYLRAHPDVIEQWVAFSEDKRTSGGWYLRPPYSIGRITSEPTPMHEVKHADLAAACAAFIIAELNTILDRAPVVRVALPSEYDELAALYLAWGYRAGIAPGDVVYVAELGNRPVGLVRLTKENTVVLLRGMYVDPTHQREGVGTQLLSALVRDLANLECYCIPFAHLASFYQRFGFIDVSNADADAPAFLLERVSQYREAGRDVLIMRRATDNLVRLS